MAHGPHDLVYSFPTDSPHAGMPLSNGTTAGLVWADQERFIITLNRQDYWNRQGEIHWGPQAGYMALREEILSGDAPRYHPDFVAYRREGEPHPCRMPLGRCSFRLSSIPGQSHLETRTGIGFLNHTTRVVMDPAVSRLHIESELPEAELTPACAPEVSHYWKTHNLPAPVRFTTQGIRGWTQSGVDHRTICVALRVCHRQTVLTVVFGDDPEHAVAHANDMLMSAPEFEDAVKASTDFFRQWWKQTPKISMEASHLQEAWDYSMFKVAGMCRPGSPPPTLQGPWVEDNALAPWQSDYHFNINVQMAHWPLLAGNHAEQYLPLIQQMREWMPVMNTYAERFAGVSQGVMLPHAANDKGMLADTNWKCQFDAGSAAWIALQLWDYYRYTGDNESLVSVIYPMLTGSLRVYAAMIEVSPGEDLFWAPSPEYVSPDQGIWFENPSFHLGFIHALVRAVGQAAAVLQQPEPALKSWEALVGRLPRATVMNGEIAVGSGVLLHESHRHLSHLAGIYPCETLDATGEDVALCDHTSYCNSKLGIGNWVGWSMPWASRIWTRMGEPRTAGFFLDHFVRNFTHKNYFSSHNAFTRGLTSFVGNRPPYIMQLDGTAGYAAAVMDTLAYEWQGEARVGTGIPPQLGDVEFEGIVLPGGRIASGYRKGDHIETHVESDESSPTHQTT